MRLQRIPLLCAALLLAVSLSSELDAQTTVSGGLAGVITDPSNAVVPDANVVVRGSAKGTIQSTKTDRQGVYQFFFLSPGRYTLTATHVGFRDETRVVNVLLGPPVSVNLGLAIAKVSTNVTVTDEAPLIRAENGDVSTTVRQKQISEIPNPGNDLTYIAQTTPGVVMNTETSFAVFSSMGMPGTSNLLTVDGMNQNETASNTGLTGASNLMLGQNQIQEATVVSIGYSGQFGGAAGANVNYITKSGGNDFHGNGQYFWNGPVFNANDWFNNAFEQPRPFSIANQWPGSLGGPIRKNKLFFFFDTEGIRVLLPQSLFVVIPSPQFETATIANIDSKFGPASASDAFYKKIFSLYNDAMGADRATSGNLKIPSAVGGSQISQPDWASASPVPHIFSLLEVFQPRIRSRLVGSTGAPVIVTVLFSVYSTTPGIIRSIQIPSVLCLILVGKSHGGRANWWRPTRSDRRLRANFCWPLPITTLATS